MGSYTFVQDGKLYYVENGKVVVLEEHYRNEIERYGNQLLEEVNGRHHPLPSISPKGGMDWLWDEAGPGPATSWRRGSRVEPTPSRSPKAGEGNTVGCFWWLLAGAVLAGLLVWWW